MICLKCKKTVRVIAKFLDDQLTSALEVAHAITTEVAKVIDNPLFQLLASQIPAGSNVDKVLSVIEEVLTTTGEVIKCDKLTGIDKVNCLMQALNLLPKDERNAILARLKSALTSLIDGNRFEKYVYDTAGQLDYFNEKVKAGAAIEHNSDYVEVIKPKLEENPILNIADIAASQLPKVEELSAAPMPTHAMPGSSAGYVEAPPTPNAF